MNNIWIALFTIGAIIACHYGIKSFEYKQRVFAFVFAALGIVCLCAAMLLSIEYAMHRSDKPAPEGAGDSRYAMKEVHI